MPESSFAVLFVEKAAVTEPSAVPLVGVNVTEIEPVAVAVHAPPVHPAGVAVTVKTVEPPLAGIVGMDVGVTESVQLGGVVAGLSTVLCGSATAANKARQFRATSSLDVEKLQVNGLRAIIPLRRRNSGAISNTINLSYRSDGDRCLRRLHCTTITPIIVIARVILDGGRCVDLARRCCSRCRTSRPSVEPARPGSKGSHRLRRTFVDRRLARSIPMIMVFFEYSRCTGALRCRFPWYWLS